MQQQRRRFKSDASFQDRLALFAEDARQKAHASRPEQKRTNWSAKCGKPTRQSILATAQTRPACSRLS